MKEQQENKEYLKKLIDRLISGTASVAEEEKLISYYESFQNSQWVEELGLEHDVKEKIHTRIVASINNSKSKKPVFKLFTVLKYAAAIVVLFSVSNIVFKNNFSEQAITKKAIDNIKPGYEKAVLILGDGTSVNLEEHKNEVIASNSLTVVQNKENILKYELKEATSEQVSEKEIYNTLLVPTGGIYQVNLPDGTNVWLNSQSSLKYPVKFIGNQRIVELEGEAYFDVTKNEKEFIVKTLTADITVLGTEFNVSAYKEDGYFASTLVEGEVKLSGENNSVMLQPGQQAYFTTSNLTIELKAVDTSIYTAWLEGKFYFEREKLGHILGKMSRWYNIEIEFEDETIKNETFTGVVLKDKSIDNLLNKITQTTNLNYTIIKNKSDEKYKLMIKRN